MSTPVADSTNRLAWLLEDLEIPGVRFAVLLCQDGLRIAPSRGVSKEDAQRFAAAAAGQRTLGK
ncbi:roadblock/LC7 domain-containing protein, partial [Nocardia sp. NPDC060220]|uniref:roadblock/LC7 domain-containing protein n=1 Tax=Nocardia sp. NPDC060220 TaxID=3347076 RepID=UPI0036538925